MKKCILLFSLLLALGSCSLKNESNITPSIYVGNLRLVHSWADSIVTPKIGYDNGTYVIDTIQMGDTIYMTVQLQSYMNTLLSFRTEYDSTLLSLEPVSYTWSPDSLYNFAAFYLHYTPKRVGKADLKLVVMSDAKLNDGLNVASISFRQPIIERELDE